MFNWDWAFPGILFLDRSRALGNTEDGGRRLIDFLSELAQFQATRSAYGGPLKSNVRPVNSPRLAFSLRSDPGYVNGAEFADSDLKTLDIGIIALSLEGSTVGDQRIQSMPLLATLRCLDLDSTNVTDESLKVLAKLPVLEELWLECTQITDTGLKSLHSAEALRFVSVAYTQVSKSGIESLKAALPALEVSA